jgi:hypothetical protein
MTKILTLIFTILISVLFTDCNKTKTVDAAETITIKVKKTWIVKSATENGSNVYTTGAASNTKGAYSKFILDLSNPPTVIFIDVDGLSFTGTYELVGETKLVLKNLSPAPYGSNGTIEFTISKIDGNTFELTRTTTNPKTGGTSNSYILTVKS